ncbi:MAG: hypothetical protein AAGF90_12095 [Pseudomonadota bacterium]
MPDKDDQTAALIFLGVVQCLMLVALFTETPPHPPLAVAPFALGPFLSASVGLAFAAAWSRARGGGPTAPLLAVAAALVSFGPQKYFDAAFPQIWPAVIAAQAAMLVIGAGVVAGRRARA